MGTHTNLIRAQQAFFQSGKTKSLSFRTEALKRLGDSVRRHEQAVTAALRADLNKSEYEAYATEIGIVLKEIRFIRRRLRHWVRPVRVPTPITHIGSRSTIYYEPYGTVLIIAPWNFPFQLALVPLIGAIAAGNCAIVKPSELTPRTSEIIARIVEDAFDPDFAAVVQGGPETSRELAAEAVDSIFYTGGIQAGKAIMEAASRNLTPVTLELGGKSPCIIEPDARLKLAARRIAWGKFLNAGQTCVAPDYVYVHESVRDPFLRHLQEAVAELYGPDPLQGGAYTRIVSDKHFHRLQNLMREGEIVFGGRCLPERRTIEPTVLTGVTWDSAVMQEEIFGPLLPVLTYRSLDEIVEAVRQRPKPLSLYLFTESKQAERQVLERISFGGGCVNDTVMHFTTPHLPFGGVGASGMGAYHGRSSFETFSHRKSVMKQTTRFDLPVRYPHVKYALRVLRKLLR